MLLVPLALALSAAVIHATWNLVAKKVGGGTVFVWLTACIVLALYAPAVIWVYFTEHPALSLVAWGFMLLSGLIHIGYFHVLLRGYRDADFSVVYPLARGSGPLLSSAGAILLLGERPAIVRIIGIVMVVGGVVLLAGGISFRNADKRLRRGLAYGGLTGGFIAAYTLTDKWAVAHLHVPPVWLDYCCAATRAILLAPVALKRQETVRWHWAKHRRECFGVAFLSALAYILVLFALKQAPVSVVAPARESSIFFGTVFGAKLLEEGQTKRRIAASVFIFAGIVFLAMS